jgi:flagellar biogenesis protein FliO
MPSIVAILGLLLAWAICPPVGAQNLSPAETSGRSGEARASVAPSPTTAASPGMPGLIRLPPPGHASDNPPPTASAHGSHSERTGGMPSLITVSGSLIFVLGLFLVVAWVMRRATPGLGMLLPKEVVEVLGRTPLAGRHQLHLLRCGQKLLLVSASPAGVETLTEITEPLEVDRLSGLCRQARPDSTTAMFRQVFQQFAHVPQAAVRVAAGTGRAGARHVAIPDDDEVELANAGIPGARETVEEGYHA